MRLSTGFSLLEMMLVVVIIGLIAAIAIPRMSQGSQGAADNAVTQDLAILRDAIDRYVLEHNRNPSAAGIRNQLRLYSDANGTTLNTNRTAISKYGPYLRAIPPVPVGNRKGQSGIDTADGPTVGWIYAEVLGTIVPNTGTLTDANGKLYTSY